MSIHNIHVCFCGEIRKEYQYFWIEKSALTSAMKAAFQLLTKVYAELLVNRLED